LDYSQYGNKKLGRSPHTTRVRNKIGLLILRVSIALVLVAGFAGLGAGIGVYFGILEASPDLDIRGLGPISPRVFGVATGVGYEDVQLSSFIVCARTGEHRETLHAGLNRTFAPLSLMPQHLVYAFVAIEDERFFEHNGVDLPSIARAVYVAFAPDRGTEGGSTITQQLVKNMLGVMDNTFITKLQEQHIAIEFERHLREEFAALGYDDPHMATKNFIMQSYLNEISLGRQNYGVVAAANFYFDLCVSELSIAQSAVIASITQAPSRLAPDRRPHNNWRRTRQVLRSMERLGFITAEEYAIATEERQVIDPITFEPMYDDDGEPIMLGVVFDTIYRRPDGGIRRMMTEFDCFTDALLDQVTEDLMREHNINRDQANHRIFNTGLTIESTQDLSMQGVVDRAFLDDSLWPGAGQGFAIEVTHEISIFNTITQLPRHYSQSHIVNNVEEAEAFIENIRERLTHFGDEITSERTFKVPQPQGAFVLLDHHTGHVLALRGVRGEKDANRAFNRATQTVRSPGSQMKPLVPFVPLIDLNLAQPSTVIDDIPFLLFNPGGEDWAPSNHWSNPPFRGLSTVRNAIYASGNVVSARAAADTRIPHAGVPTMKRYLEDMGISTLQPTDGAAMVLGGMAGTLLIELAGAYATIANAGEFNRPVLYTRVLDHEGNILLENGHNPQRVMRATTAYLLTHSMIDTIGRGTGGRINWTQDSGLRGQIPIAGKTGTSQRNRDLGFAGYTPYFTAAIWMGNDNNTAMHSRAREFHTPLWRTIMQEIHMDLEPRRFDRPAGIVTATVCLDSGHLLTDYCHRDPRGSRASRTEVFAAGMIPTQQCRVHQEKTYCSESGMLATEHCPYWTVVTRVGIVRAMPIDDIEEVVGDRVHEFPLYVRQGLSCTYHTWGGFFGASPQNEWVWDPDIGMMVRNPNFVPPADGLTDGEGFGTPQEVPNAGYQPFVPTIPDTPPPGDGDATHVTTVEIPGIS